MLAFIFVLGVLSESKSCDTQQQFTRQHFDEKTMTHTHTQVEFVMLELSTIIGIIRVDKCNPRQILNLFHLSFMCVKCVAART